jgi:hypothetical protein
MSTTFPENHSTALVWTLLLFLLQQRWVWRHCMFGAFFSSSVVGIRLCWFLRACQAVMPNLAPSIPLSSFMRIYINSRLSICSLATAFNGVAGA